jgi:hypothetical protein
LTTLTALAAATKTGALPGASAALSKGEAGQSHDADNEKEI